MLKIKKMLTVLTGITVALTCTAVPTVVSAEEMPETTVVNNDVSVASVVLVYQAMSRADYLEMYNDCYDTAKPKHRKIQTGRVLPSKKYSRKCWQIASKHMHCKHWQI